MVVDDTFSGDSADSADSGDSMDAADESGDAADEFRKAIFCYGAHLLGK